MWKYILVVVAVLGILGGVYSCGRIDENTKQENKQLTAIVESEKKHEKKTREVITLPTDTLRQRYCKWMRDSESECLQADIPILEGSGH